MDGLNMLLLGFLLSEAALVGLLVYQSWFYGAQIKALVDRLMARDISQFEQAKNPPPPRQPVMRIEPPTEDFDRILG